MIGWLVLICWAFAFVVVARVASMVGFSEFSDMTTWIALIALYAANLLFVISLAHDFMTERRRTTLVMMSESKEFVFSMEPRT